MWKHWLSLSKNEQKGYVFLGGVCLFLLIGYFLIPLCFSYEEGAFVIDNLEKKYFNTPGEKVEKNSEKKSVKGYDSLFRFDPNKVTVEEMQRLGFSNYAIINWIKYLQKGGIFQTPHDLTKIYGIKADHYLVVKPFIYIDNKKDDGCIQRVIDLNHVDNDFLYREGLSEVLIDSIGLLQAEFYFTRKIAVNKLQGFTIEDFMRFAQSNTKKKYRKSRTRDDFVIDINEASAHDFRKIKGVGEVLSARIVKYRKLLGGFYSIDQLKEVYGIDDLLIDKNKQYFKVNESEIARININRSNLSFIRKHPYVNFYQAKEIVEYRKRKGGVECLSEILSLPVFMDADTVKLRHYLAVK
ncbi:hypothetical protein DMA11_03145 [Marinilabiliaceae bacterium JC017]|nr:hypothetical protein DMA11_03145 [Marinilabiliaceae bacterium JC017]